MPEKRTAARAKRDLRQGKSPSTAAGEFVKEEMDHIRSGKHGAKSAKQAVAIGLSKARRAGVPLPPRKGTRRTKARHRALSRQAHQAARRRDRADRRRAGRRAAATRRR